MPSLLDQNFIFPSFFLKIYFINFIFVVFFLNFYF